MTRSSRVLVVEDDAVLARGLVDILEAEGYRVRHVLRGDLAENAIGEFKPAAVILDISLPGRSGLEILRSLRERAWRGAVLMLTARGEVADRVLGLEMGADDYLAKPFSLAELRARIRALLRRAGEASELEGLDGIQVGEIYFDFRGLGATDAAGEILDLTVRDVLVLKMLAEARGAAVSRLDIVEEICGLQSTATARTVDNHIVALRKAIGDHPRKPRLIQTVRGVGYRLTIC